jgi:hypothetical protein
MKIVGAGQHKLSRGGVAGPVVALTECPRKA